MNEKYIILGMVFTIAILMVSFSPQVQSYIPPTPAWFRITSGGANVTAGNSSAIVNFIAGSNITITPDFATNSITFSSSGGGGPSSSNIWNIDCTPNFIQIFSNSTHPNFTCGTVPASGSTFDTMQNIGTGQASIYAGNTTNTNFTFKTLKQGQNISLANNTNDITITSAGFQNNTASNVGGDYGWFKQKVGVDLQFKSVKAGSNISLQNNTNDITITATDTGEVNTASNFGTFGTGIFKDKNGVDLRFLKVLSIDPLITITSNSSNVMWDLDDSTFVKNNAANTYTGSNAQAFGTNFATFGSDPGDSLDVRFSNGGGMSFEFSPTGTDGTIVMDSSENLVLSSGWNNVDLGLNPTINEIFDVAGTGNRLTSTSIAAGDLLKGDGTDFKRFARGTNGNCLTSTAGDIAWGSCDVARETLAAEWPVDRTWVNIGTAYTNVYATGLGDPIRIDTNGMTKVSLIIDWTKVGAGTQNCGIVNQATPTSFLIIINNLASGLNTNATQTIPAAFSNTILNVIPVCKSTTGADDPVWLSGNINFKP